MPDPKDIYRRYCTCGDLELSHDLNTKGVRTACFHIEGPRGVHCPCKLFEEAPHGPLVYRRYGSRVQGGP